MCSYNYYNYLRKRLNTKDVEKFSIKRVNLIAKRFINKNTCSRDCLNRKLPEKYGYKSIACESQIGKLSEIFISKKIDKIKINELIFKEWVSYGYRYGLISQFFLRWNDWNSGIPYRPESLQKIQPIT